MLPVRMDAVVEGQSVCSNSNDMRGPEMSFYMYCAFVFPSSEMQRFEQLSQLKLHPRLRGEIGDKWGRSTVNRENTYRKSISHLIAAGDIVAQNAQATAARPCRPTHSISATAELARVGDGALHRQRRR